MAQQGLIFRALLFLIIVSAVGYSVAQATTTTGAVSSTGKDVATTSQGLAKPSASILTPVRMLVEPADRIQVKGFRGNVSYTVDENTKDITVQVTQEAAKTHPDEWQFSFKREADTIYVTVDGPVSKAVWSEVLAAQDIPKFHLRITGPSRPLDINWYEGEITVANLQSDLRVASTKSNVQLQSGLGELVVANQEGVIVVKGHKGSVRIDAYQAKVDLDNIDGQVDVHNFTGDTDLQNIQGQVAISSYKGPTKVAGVTGRLEFKNGNSPLRIEKFKGELRGRSAQGAVYAEVQGEADVRVESAEGTVHLRLPASGAWVNLGTSEGSMAVPNFLKSTRLQSQQLRTGRLRGTSGGSVFIRTTSGDIRIQ